jgi:hypothetical protein
MIIHRRSYRYTRCLCRLLYNEECFAGFVCALTIQRRKQRQSCACKGCGVYSCRKAYICVVLNTGCRFGGSASQPVNSPASEIRAASAENDGIPNIICFPVCVKGNYYRYLLIRFRIRPKITVFPRHEKMIPCLAGLHEYPVIRAGRSECVGVACRVYPLVGQFIGVGRCIPHGK